MYSGKKAHGYSARIGLSLFMAVSAAHSVYSQPLELTRRVDNTVEVPEGQPGETFLGYGQVAMAGGKILFGAAGNAGFPGTTGVFELSSAGLERILRGENELSGALPGERLARLSNLGYDGDSLVFDGEGFFGTRGVYSTIGGPLAPVADSFTTVPGISGSFDLIDMGTLLPGGLVAFRGHHFMPLDIDLIGLFLHDGEELSRLVDNDTLIPGQTVEFRNFEEGMGMIGNEIFFEGEAEGPEDGEGGDSGVYGVTTEGVLRVVADPATVVPVPPGQPGETFIAVEIWGVDDDQIVFLGIGPTAPLGFYAARQDGIVFLTSLESIPGLADGSRDLELAYRDLSGSRAAFVLEDDTAGTTLALYATQGDQLIEVLGVGDNLDGQTVSDIGDLGADGDQVAFAVTFDDGTRALYTATFPLFASDFETGSPGAWDAVVP